MKALLNTLAAAAALFVAAMAQAHAEFTPSVPEPSSLALSGLGLAAAVYFLRNSRKK